jgi:polyisoprenyl-teichoic acid--peptidoglycan teichoic acid transferase
MTAASFPPAAGQPAPTRRVLATALVTLIALVAVLASAAAAAITHHTEIRPGFASDDLVTILVIGSDIGWPPRPGDELHGRADALHLLAVDTKAKKATIVDIPRDSLIGGTKVNAHLANGGPERLVETMAAYSGVGIDHWALTTFQGLRRMTEEMDGIEVTVEQRMTATGGAGTIEAGEQRLGPQQALGFARDRKSQPRGDFDRTRNQGLLLRAAHEQILREGADLASLSRLAASFIRDTHSSIPRMDVLRLAVLAAQIDPADILQVPLSGSIGTGAGGASIVHLAPGDAFERIAAGQVGP